MAPPRWSDGEFQNSMMNIEMWHVQRATLFSGAFIRSNKKKKKKNQKTPKMTWLNHPIYVVYIHQHIPLYPMQQVYIIIIYQIKATN